MFVVHNVLSRLVKIIVVIWLAKIVKSDDFVGAVS